MIVLTFCFVFCNFDKLNTPKHVVVLVLQTECGLCNGNYNLFVIVVCNNISWICCGHLHYPVNAKQRNEEAHIQHTICLFIYVFRD